MNLHIVWEMEAKQIPLPSFHSYCRWVTLKKRLNEVQHLHCCKPPGFDSVASSSSSFLSEDPASSIWAMTQVSSILPLFFSFPRLDWQTNDVRVLLHDSIKLLPETSVVTGYKYFVSCLNWGNSSREDSRTWRWFKVSKYENRSHTSFFAFLSNNNCSMRRFPVDWSFSPCVLSQMELLRVGITIFGCVRPSWKEK